MTTSLAGADGDTATMGAPIEKTPLERYVAPAKPSLVGLSRAALAEALGGIGVPERAAQDAGAADLALALCARRHATSTR